MQGAGSIFNSGYQGTRGQGGCECLCPALLSRFSSLIPSSFLPSPFLPPSLPSISYSHSFSFPHLRVGSLSLSSCPLVPFPILPLHTQEELISVARLLPQISTPPQRLTPPFTHLVPSRLSCGQAGSVAIGPASSGPGLFLTVPGSSCNQRTQV